MGIQLILFNLFEQISSYSLETYTTSIYCLSTSKYSFNKILKITHFDDDYELADDTKTFQVEDLLQVIEINRDTMQVKLSDDPQRGGDESMYPLLRRWDNSGEGTSGGALKLVEDEWIELEDGIKIMFASDIQEGQGTVPYITRGWWWITARTETGDVEWPLDNNDDPLAMKALEHGNRYAPLR